MLRSDYHECYAIESVRTCGINSELLVLLFYLKVYERTCRLAYPVLLLEFDVRQVVDLFKTLKELVSVLSDSQIPNFLCFLNYFAVANVAMTAL